MAVLDARTAEFATVAAVEERGKLRKHFGRADIFFFLVCTLVGIDGLGTIAAGGGEAFTWLVIAVALFAIPSSMVLAELGAAYPQEGGPYVWVRMAFGHLPASVNNFLYWVTNPVWLGGTLVATALAVLVSFYNGGASFSRPVVYAFGLTFIWLGVLVAVLSFAIGKWVATIGAYARFALLGFFTVTVVVYGLQNGFQGIGTDGFSPTYSGFVALVPLILFSLVGFELPNSAGEEMKDPQRDVPAGVFKSVAATALLYGLPVLGILLVLPLDQVKGFAGFADALKQSFTVYGGSTAADGTVTLTGAGSLIAALTAVVFVLVVFTSGVTWIMGSDRALAVSGYDGAAPRALGAISARFGTPVRVNILSGVVSTVILIAATEITQGNTAKFFTVALNLAISTTLLSYLGIFPAAWKLRRTRPADHRPYRAPMLGALTIMSTLWILFATLQLLFPGIGDGWFSTGYLPSADWVPEERWTYLLTELVPLVVFIALGVLFWVLGLPTREAVATAPSAPVAAERS